MIGIVILNYNTQEETVECVESIVKTTNSNYKIYIVDNNSKDKSYERLKRLYLNYDSIEVIKSEKNDGYSAGNNLGIKKALSDGADVIFLSNSDIVFHENSLDAMYEYLLKNQNIGIIGPKIILKNGSIQKSPRHNYNFKNYIFTKKPFKILDCNNNFKKTYFENYDYKQELIFDGLVSGCCIGLTNKYFDLCGLLDESTFLYFEESIIAIKASEVDLKTCLYPKSSVLHKSSLSIGNQNSAFSRYHRYYSSTYMLYKYAKINRIQLIFIFLLNLSPLVLYGIFDKKYREFAKMYIERTIKLIKNIQ